MALDADTHRVYLVSSKFAPAPAGSAANPHPGIVPDTFNVLVAQRKPRSVGN